MCYGEFSFLTKLFLNGLILVLGLLFVYGCYVVPDYIGNKISRVLEKIKIKKLRDSVTNIIGVLYFILVVSIIWTVFDFVNYLDCDWIF